MRLTDEQLLWCVEELGISPEDFLRVRQAASDEAARQALDDLHRKAKKGFRAASRRLHPDLHGDDPEKAAQLQLLSVAYEEILNTDVPKGMVARPVEGAYQFTPKKAKTRIASRFVVRVRCA